MLHTEISGPDDNMKNDEALADTGDTDLVVATHTGRH